MRIESCGINKASGRDVFLLESTHLTDFPHKINLPSRYFTLLLACDARQSNNDVIADVARSLTEQGVVYVCTWGPDCERVHDMFDEVIVGANPNETEHSVIMTSWHNDESLDEALWFLLNVAFPANNYADECQAEVVAVVGNDEWAVNVRSRLADQDGLERDVVGEETED